MKHLFYFLAILPIIWEMMNLVSIKKTHEIATSMKGKKYDDYSTSQKTLGVCMLGYIIWTFIGLFSFQWVLFLGLILFRLIPKKYIWFRWIYSLISFIVLVFILLNGYHFKIDVWSAIWGFEHNRYINAPFYKL